MSSEIQAETVLASTVGVPDDVVKRSFANETVVLNLTTGQYHGLNFTAGRMFDALEQEGTVREAADALSAEFAVPGEQIRHDIVVFCNDLVERGLLRLRRDA